MRFPVERRKVVYLPTQKTMGSTRGAPLPIDQLKDEKMEYMMAYEFYYRDQADQPHLIGILPERRKDLQRITSESIMNWVKKLLGNGWDMDRVDFVEVTIDKATGEISESKKVVNGLENKN